MMRRNLIILLVLCTSLMLRADSCVLEQRKVSQVSSLGVPAEWVSEGWTESEQTLTDTIDIAADVRDALAGVNLANIVAIKLSGGAYNVKESTGHDARRNGWVRLTDDSDNPAEVFNFDIPTNVAGTSGTAGDGTLTMVSDGVDFMNGRVADWLAAYKANPVDTSYDNLLVFDYTVFWQSTPAPDAEDPDNFTWTTDVIIHVETVVDIDVVNP